MTEMTSTIHKQLTNSKILKFFLRQISTNQCVVNEQILENWPLISSHPVSANLIKTFMHVNKQSFIWCLTFINTPTMVADSRFISMLNGLLNNIESIQLTLQHSYSLLMYREILDILKNTFHYFNTEMIVQFTVDNLI